MKNERVPRGKMLLKAGQCLAKCDKLISTLPRRISVGQSQELFSLCKNFYAYGEEAGLDFAPKLHLWAHQAERSERQGNPQYFSTWKDEALNKVIATIAKGVGTVHFEARVLLRFREEMAGRLPKAKRAKLHH